nr:aminotransferase class I/II-fold pyridoxal phosphate-dependent enzyme [Paenibacillus pini]
MLNKCKESAPLVEALNMYRNSNKNSFHVPGHKNGQAYKHTESAGFLSQVMSVDVTEITGTDDLHHPEGVILEAQVLAASCFGAEESFFLVGGSTVGNLAMILTVCTHPGDILLVQRNVHKSVLNGLMLAGARAVFLQPQIDSISGLAVAPTPSGVEAALNAYPEAKGVFITMPNYHGMGTDLTPIAEICHRQGIPLLVDEAHGAHYGQHPELPGHALSCGADVVVQSTHKMLSALTMGAMLHVQGSRINRDLLRQRLAMVQSSSPSYPVMASLDLARRQLHVLGAEAFTAGLAAVNTLKRGLAELPRFKLLQPVVQQQTTAADVAAYASTGRDLFPAEPDQAGAYTTQDPFKVVIYDDAGVLSGYELQQQLEAHGCVPEMSDEQFVVLLFSLGSTLDDTRRLLDALRRIDEDVSSSPLKGDRRTIDTAFKSHAGEFSTWNNFNELQISEPVTFNLQPVKEIEVEAISISDCAGRVAAEMIIPYPPGIPLIYAGERICNEMAVQLKRLAMAGAKCHGTADLQLQTVRVFKNHISQEEDI